MADIEKALPTSTVFFRDAADDAKLFCHLPISTWSAERETPSR
jgi:hypothetical protein